MNKADCIVKLRHSGMQQKKSPMLSNLINNFYKVTHEFQTHVKSTLDDIELEKLQFGANLLADFLGKEKLYK